MSLKSALISYKKELEEAVIDSKISDMLKEQQEILDKSISDKSNAKKPKKSFNPEVLMKGGNTDYKFNDKWYKISVQVNSSDVVKKYNFHIRNAMGYRVFVSAKTYQEAQMVIDSMLGKGYIVSGSVV